jgi:hypothetical protein
MMHFKTTFALALCLNLGFTLSAQNLKRFKIDAFYGIEHVETNNKGSDLWVPRNRKQEAKNFGLNLNYELNDRFFIRSGFRMTHLTETVVSNFLFDCGNVTPEEIALMTTELKTKHFTEIALSSGVRYYVQKKKPIFNMYVESGVDWVNDNDGIKPNMSISYGFEATLWEKCAIFIQPTYRFAINKTGLSRRLDSKIQQHNIGATIGFRF